MIYPELECIFVHIPKTGGTSIENALVGLDSKLAQHDHDHRSLWAIDPRWPVRSWIAPPSLTLPYAKESARLLRHTKAAPPALSAQDYSRYYKLAFVRNPWGRAVSWYRNVLRDPKHRKRHNCTEDTDFSIFLNQFAGQGMLKPQMFWLKDRSGKLGVDRVGRFENLVEDFNDILGTRFQQTIELPHKLNGKTEDFRTYYSDTDAALVARIYAEEIETFGYAFDD